jgi:Holliday junction resolvase RusA-like endonuclease
MRVTFDLPICPSTNMLYANIPARNGRGGRVKTTVYRNWIKAARAELWAQKPAGGFPFFHGEFWIVIHVPLAMRGDVDNRAKAAIDFLKRGAGVIPDDNKTYAATVTRDPTVPAGRCFIAISDQPIARTA